MRSLRHCSGPRVRRSRRTAAHDDGLLWLFDLDNTLHDTSHAIFPRIDHGMTMAVAETLGVTSTRPTTCAASTGSATAPP